MRIPDKIDRKLAEAQGIHDGDGHIRAKSYGFKVSGHRIEDRPYLLAHVRPLHKELFNLEPTIVENPIRNELSLEYASKVVYTFLTKVQGLPPGRKRESNIPQTYKEDTGLLRRYLRGLGDTDGTISFKRPHNARYHYYPIIEIDRSTKRLIKQVAGILPKFGITCCTQYNKRNSGKGKLLHRVEIQGIDNLERWMKNIGFMNPKHLTKVLLWCRYGVCPPKTTLEERLIMLRAGIDPRCYYDEKGGHMKAYRLMRREREILHILAKDDPQTTRKLSARITAPKSTLKKTLTRMFRRGKIARLRTTYHNSKYSHGWCYRWIAKDTAILNTEKKVEEVLRDWYGLL